MINLLKTKIFPLIIVVSATFYNCERHLKSQPIDLEVQFLELHNWLERGTYKNEFGNNISYYFMRDNTLKTALISHSSDTIHLALKADSCQIKPCFKSVLRAIIEKDTIDIFGFSNDYLIVPPYDTISCLLKFNLKNHYFNEFWSREISVYTEKMIDTPIIHKINFSDYNNFHKIPNILFTKASKIWIYNQQETAYKANRPK